MEKREEEDRRKGERFRGIEKEKRAKAERPTRQKKKRLKSTNEKEKEFERIRKKVYRDLFQNGEEWRRLEYSWGSRS